MKTFLKAIQTESKWLKKNQSNSERIKAIQKESWFKKNQRYSNRIKGNKKESKQFQKNQSDSERIKQNRWVEESLGLKKLVKILGIWAYKRVERYLFLITILLSCERAWETCFLKGKPVAFWDL